MIEPQPSYSPFWQASFGTTGIHVWVQSLSRFVMFGETQSWKVGFLCGFEVVEVEARGCSSQSEASKLEERMHEKADELRSACLDGFGGIWNGVVLARLQVLRMERFWVIVDFIRGLGLWYLVRSRICARY
ncbi:hypothetical protein Droror1_Dr00002357 [Drosera rotundifolia]